MPWLVRRVGVVTYSMIMFVMVSALCGVLIAGLIVPAVGAATVGSRATKDDLAALPESLAVTPIGVRSKMLDNKGKVLAYFFEENRVIVGLDQIAPVMRQAQLAIEDSRFYRHGPIDLQGTLRAFLRNQTTQTTQGGSTITQQYVKMIQIERAVAAGNLQAVADAQATTYARKFQELRYAIALEENLTKDQILEGYLNIAYFGDGAYGVQAAAEHYFSTTAAKLTLPQAAMLAGLVQNPNANNPITNLDGAIARRNFVLSRMAEVKMITATAAAKAKKVRFDPGQVKTIRSGCVETRFPFLCDYVRRTLLQTPSLGKSPDARQELLNRGGLTIKTKIDAKTQKATQKAVSKFVDARDPIISVMAIVEPGTGLISAMAQSRPVMGSSARKGETYYNYAVAQNLGGAEGYQAGSTFKAFTAAAALEKGIPLNRRFNARHTMDYSEARFQTCHGRREVYGSWQVRNSTQANGVMDMYRGTASSVNNYFVQLELATGMCRVTKMARKAGVVLADPDLDLVDFYQDKPSFTLGTAEVTPLSMAAAYATFASGGIHCDPIIIAAIIDRDGKPREAPSANCERVISKDVAAGMNSLLSRVMAPGGTGTPARVPGIAYQAGKTGTIDDSQAVWFVGYTRELAGAAMIAIDKTRKPFKPGSKNRRSGLTGYTMPHSDHYLNGTGGGDAGSNIWLPAMTAALKGKPDRPFRQPSTKIRFGKNYVPPELRPRVTPPPALQQPLLPRPPEPVGP